MTTRIGIGSVVGVEAILTAMEREYEGEIAKWQDSLRKAQAAAEETAATELSLKGSSVPVSPSGDTAYARAMAASNTAREAAVKMMKLFNPISTRINREFGGLLYKDADGKIRSTTPIRGSEDELRRVVARGVPLMPSGATVVGSWHTHARYRRHTDQRLSQVDINTANSNVIQNAYNRGMSDVSVSFCHGLSCYTDGTHV